MSCVAALAAGCATDGRGTAPPSECRGRAPIPLTEPVIAAMSRDQLERAVAHNESLERECGFKAPNPSGKVKR